MKSYSLLILLAALQVFPGESTVNLEDKLDFFYERLSCFHLNKGHGFILEGCVRPLTITKLIHRPEMNSLEFQINSTPVQALDWKSCFLSCCSQLPYCSQVVYSKQRCSHVHCTGSQGFCKYRPGRLTKNSLHGIIIVNEKHGKYNTQGITIVYSTRKVGWFSLTRETKCIS